MPRTLTSARRNYNLSAVIARRAVREARKARGSGIGAVATVVAVHQIANAQTSQAAVGDMLAEQEIEAPPDALLNLPAFSTELAAVEAMMAEIEADMEAEFDRLIASLVQDAGRAAESVAVAVRDGVRHVRFVNPPCCSRCAILAGRVYRWSDGFQRHPNCFPAGVVASGPTALGATRRRYEGELVILRTAGGEELPATANHPILTNKGWVPANLLQVGDQVVRGTRPEGALPLVVPNEQQAPALIEDVRGADGMVPLGVVPTAAEDFHGDGGHGEVDVVLANGFLWDGLHPAFTKFAHQEQLARRIAQALSFTGGSAREQLLLRVPHSAHGIVGGAGLRDSLLRSHAAGADLASSGHVAEVYPLLHQALADRAAGNAVTEAERVLALSGAVRRRNVGGRELLDSPRWDAPPGSFAGQDVDGYARRGMDLLPRLAGQVALDRIVKLERVGFRGHVYNLTSAEGWFSANGLIVSNCDCSMIPTTVASPFRQDPGQLVEDGLVTGLSKADQQAIRDGADLNQVVNVRRQAAGLLEAGHALTRGSRPTPASIYRRAGDDRDLAVSLLNRHGYIR